MLGPTTERDQQSVTRLTCGQSALNQRGMVGGHVDRALVAKEIGCVQEVEVQRMALDPFAAVHQAAQLADRSVDRDPARLLHREAGARLVGDRADAADARRDVGHLGEVPPAEDPLEEARWLVDTQLHVEHLAVADANAHPAFALDPREGRGADPAAGRAVKRSGHNAHFRVGIPARSR